LFLFISTRSKPMLATHLLLYSFPARGNTERVAIRKFVKQICIRFSIPLQLPEQKPQAHLSFYRLINQSSFAWTMQTYPAPEANAAAFRSGTVTPP
jgi:hypothetical protein